MFDKKKQEEYLHLSSYIEKFAALKLNVTNGIAAPHKPVMLLSVIQLISKGIMLSNRIWPANIIKEEFEVDWHTYIPEDSMYKPSVWLPYWHLKRDEFWHFQQKDDTFNLESIVGANNSTTIGKIREHVEYAYLDEALFDLLQYDANRQVLSRVLIETYLL